MNIIINLKLKGKVSKLLRLMHVPFEIAPLLIVANDIKKYRKTFINKIFEFNIINKKKKKRKKNL